MGSRLIWGFGIVLAVIIIFVSVVLIYRYANSTQNSYLKHVERIYSDMPSAEAELITEDDLAELPDPVRKYLEYVGVVGTQKVHSFSVKIEGEFKMSAEKDFAPVVVEQFSFTDNPARLFFMEMKFMGMKIFGLHHYESANASMVIKILDLVTVADACGPEMDIGETVTVFNDMCILAPAALIDSRISWRQIDDLSVEGTFTNGDISVSATLYFNETGQLINFISEDRYYWNEDNTYDLFPWATPLGDYKEINGLNLAAYGEAVWMKEEGPFTYAKFKMRDVTINPEIR